jgi:hypothetical protein
VLGELLAQRIAIEAEDLRGAELCAALAKGGDDCVLPDGDLENFSHTTGRAEPLEFLRLLA